MAQRLRRQPPLSEAIAYARKELALRRREAGARSQQAQHAKRKLATLRAGGANGKRQARTEVAMLAYLANYAVSGNLTHSAIHAGVSRLQVYNWRAHPDFLELEQQAKQDAIDRLEQEAYRRAVVGVERPVYQLGEKVGTVREYSDHLLTTLLKGHRPEVYKDRQEVTGKDGTPLFPGVPRTIDEVAKMTDREQLELLKRATEAIEAEIVNREER